MMFSVDSVLSRRTPRLLTVREWNCGIVKLKGVDGNGGQSLSCSAEHRYFTIYLKFVLCHPVFGVRITVRCDVVFRRVEMFSGKALLNS